MELVQFKELTQNFITYLDVQKNLSIHTLRAYENDLRQFITFWEELQNREPNIPHGIERLMQRHVLALFHKKLSKASLARKFSCFRSLQQFGRMQNIELQGNFKSPKLDKKLPSILSIDEINYLLDGISNGALDTKFPLRDKAVLEFLYATGVRCAELVNIKLNDIDFTDKSIRVLGKGRKERIVLFGDKAKVAVDRYLAQERPALTMVRSSYALRASKDKDEAPLGAEALAKAAHHERHFEEDRREVYPELCRRISKDAGWLFLNYNGGQLTTRSIQRICEMFRVHLKINKPITPHKLRHSFATHLLQQGADLRMVQELLGHATLTSTEIYTHIASSELAKMCQEKHPINEMLKRHRQPSE